MTDTPSAVKFGFTISKNVTKTVNVAGNKRKETEETETRDYVLSISGTDIQSSQTKENTGPMVIPMQQLKTQRINAKYLKLVPNSSATDSASTNGTTQENEANGENKEQTGENKQDAKKDVNDNSEDAMAIEELMRDAKGENIIEVAAEIDLPLLIKHRNADLDSIEDEGERFKADVDSRPEVASLEDYDNVPIEAFGKALLRGMGWAEGKPIGLTNPQVVQPIEYVKRPGYRTGLGADPSEMPGAKPAKKYIKPGESRDDNQPKVLVDSEGRTRHTKHIDEKLVPVGKTGIREGSTIEIMRGKHDGMYGIVSRTGAKGDLVVKLMSGEEVRVYKEDCKLVDERTARKSSSSSRDSKSSSKSKNSSSSSSSSSRDSKSSSSSSSKSSSSSSSSSGPSSSWLFPGIVVRIVSKSFQDGKYYLKKGNIHDVNSPTDCTIQLLDDSKKLLDVKQRMLETVIPKEGSKVMIVSGSHKGKLGTLMSKEKKSNGDTRAVVQLAEDLNLEHFDLDSISQYIALDR